MTLTAWWAWHQRGTSMPDARSRLKTYPATLPLAGPKGLGPLGSLRKGYCCERMGSSLRGYARPLTTVVPHANNADTAERISGR